MKMRSYLFIMFFVANGCSSLGPRKVVLDSSTTSTPNWANSPKTAWADDGKIFIKASSTVNGTDRLDACFSIAKLNGRENLLSEIVMEVRGTINQANQSLSESAENYLTQVRSGEFSGRLIGLRFSEEYFERFVIQDKERISCYALGEVKEVDYNAVKREIVDRVAAIDNRLKEAITEKDINFFKRQPSSQEPSVKTNKAVQKQSQEELEHAE